MSIASLLKAYDREQRREVLFPDTRREELPRIVRHLLEYGRRQGWVIWSQFGPDEIEAAIDAQIAYFEGIGYSFEWKVFDYDSPPDLRERLAARGFEIHEPSDAIMVLDFDTMPEILQQPVPDCIRRITSPDAIPALMRVLETVWGTDMSGLSAELANQMNRFPDVLSMVAAYVDDRPVSTAWIQYTPGNFAGLWGGSTLPEYRGQGFYTGLLAVRAHEARARGKRYLTVDASPMSRPILERFGFVKIAMATECVWKVGSDEV